MSLRGVRSCGDYMFSGHTVVLTLLNFFITECKCLNFYHSFHLHRQIFILFYLNRYANQLVLPAHRHMGPQFVWYIFHPCRTRTLLNRRLHRLLHHHQVVPILSFLSQQPSLDATRQSTYPHMVSAVLLFRIQGGLHRSKRIRVAVLNSFGCEVEMPKADQHFGYTSERKN